MQVKFQELRHYGFFTQLILCHQKRCFPYSWNFHSSPLQGSMHTLFQPAGTPSRIWPWSRSSSSLSGQGGLGGAGRVGQGISEEKANESQENIARIAAVIPNRRQRTSWGQICPISGGHPHTKPRVPRFSKYKPSFLTFSATPAQKDGEKPELY